MGRVRRWKPVLNGKLRAVALEVACSIAEILRKRRVREASLARGTAGLSLLYGYLAESRSGCDDKEIARKFLGQAADALASTRMTPFFFGGFTGVAWANAHLEKRLFNSDGEDTNEAIDHVLKDHLKLTPWRGEYDLVSGLVGYGVYALERLPRQTGVDCLVLVIDRLDEIAERSAQGVTWRTAPELLSENVRKDFPEGYYNLGLAHGIPGVIAFLGKVCAIPDERLQTARAKAELLLRGAVAWLLAQQPADGRQSFPFWTGRGIPAASGRRTAWCYGDLGIAVALLGAARCVKERAWEREARMIGGRVAESPAKQSDVVDGGLCHGAAGAGQLFNRLFQATGEPRFATAARFWFERTLEMRRPNQGIAGFVAFMPKPERPGKKRWIAAPGVLEGAAGIALALLAAATPIEPEWDRMLLA